MVLSYGNSEYPEDELVVNKPGFISTVSHKLRLSRLLTEQGINTVQFSRGTPSEEDYPVFVRMTLQGMKGDGIVVCNTPEEFSRYGGRFYWSKGLDIRYEYRVHAGVKDGKVKLLKVFKKIPFTDEPTPIKASTNCRFSLRYHENRFGLLREFLNPFSKIPLFSEGSFFSLDVGLQTDGRYVVFEGNTASGLNSKTAKTYLEFLRPYLNL